jgi:acetyl esterase/lipase
MIQSILGLWFRAVFRLVLRLPGPALLRISNQAPLILDGRALDPRLQFHAWFVQRFRRRRALTPAELRKSALIGLGLLEGSALPMAGIVDRTIPGPAGEIPIRVYRPCGASAEAPVLVYYHFGGCVIGDLDTCHTACSYIAHHSGCVVVSVGYRLAPEHKFPAALEDAVSGYLWTRRNAKELGGDPARVGVGGDSAGGYLAAAVCLVMRETAQAMPNMQLLIYPVVDMERDRMPTTAFDTSYPLSREDIIWFAQHYLRHPDDAVDPRCSIGRTASLLDMPETIVVLAGHDPLYAEGLQFARRLRADGVVTVLKSYEHLAHAFTAMSGCVPGARAALVEIAELVASALNRSRQGTPKEQHDRWPRSDHEKTELGVEAAEARTRGDRDSISRRESP